MRFPGCSGILVLVLLGVSLQVRAGLPDWSLYDRLLQAHVSERQEAGIQLHWVDYSALRQDPRLDSLRRQLAQVTPEALDSRERRLAFYINAYNILALAMVADHWPLESIRDLGNWFSPVWDREAGEVAGKTLSLGEIEHEILRPMDEPRIHMAIVCASLSCPDLRLKAYRAQNLEQQLESQTSAFLANSTKGVKRTGEGVSISKIFDWFEEDFDTRGGVQSFINAYLDEPVSGSFGHLDYDWRVNGD